MVILLTKVIIPLKQLNDHGIPSLGYVLEEKKRIGRFNREKAIELGVPVGRLFFKTANR